MGKAGTHILIDGVVNGQKRNLITHSARNGFLYTMERSNGQTLLAKPYMDDVNLTKGIDQKTGKPLNYDPTKDAQPDHAVCVFTVIAAAGQGAGGVHTLK